MFQTEIKLVDTNILHPLVKDIINGNFPKNIFVKDDLDSLNAKFKERKFESNNRKILVESLKEQYLTTFPEAGIEKQLQLIHSLENGNTFTVTTGHQLCMFGGPLYFILKIASTINLANQLNNAQSENKVIPVFWMATEDHDFEEIAPVHLFNKTLKWNRSFSGPVGRMSTFGIQARIDEVEELIKNAPFGNEVLEILRSSYLTSKTLSEATRKFVHHLYKNTDLLIIDADAKELKSLFKKEFISELNSSIGLQEVNHQSQALTSQGKKYDLPVSPREINLFEITNTTRTRILKEEASKYLDVVENNPENISPNVIFRPLYQEVILPNIAYIGGTNEVAYWYQLKSLFNKLEVPYPSLFVRNSVAFIIEKQIKDIQKLKLDISDFFTCSNIQELTQTYYQKNDINLEIEDIFENINLELQKVKSATKDVDSSLGANLAKQSNEFLGNIKKIQKEIKSYKEKTQEESILKLQKIYQQIFPEGSLQERRENFIPFYAYKGLDFINELVEELNPLNENLVILK